MSNNLKAAAAALNKKTVEEEKKAKEKENLEEFKSLASKVNGVKSYKRINYSEVHDNRSKIAAEFKKERLSQGLTQRELAQLSNHAASTISANEKWGSAVHTMLCIANALGKELTIN